MSAFKEGHEAVTLIYSGGLPHEEEFTTVTVPANHHSQENPQPELTEGQDVD